MEMSIEIPCDKAIPLSDDSPQNIFSFVFFIEESKKQDYVLINTPNGGFLVSRQDFGDIFMAMKKMNYYLNEDELKGGEEEKK